MLSLAVLISQSNCVTVSAQLKVYAVSRWGRVKTDWKSFGEFGKAEVPFSRPGKFGNFMVMVNR